MCCELSFYFTQTHSTRSKLRNQAKARVDCSDPHPAATRHIHTLEELEILPGRQELNPRFQQQTCPQRSSNKQHRSKFSVVSGLSSKVSSDTVPGDIAKYPSNSKKLRTAVTSPDTKETTKGMETVQLSFMEKAVGINSLPTNHKGYFQDEIPHCYFQNGASQSSEVECTDRQSVSSSESIGINPEDYSMDIVRDAFSEENELEETNEKGQKVGSLHDKIVGLEVSSDESQTTVNLLHLLGHKNKAMEQAKTAFQNQELWVIEEGEEEDKDEEMEEEIFLSSGESVQSLALPVPQLFVVDENDQVVEQVKIGRRKQSRDTLNQESSPDELNIHSLSIHSP